MRNKFILDSNYEVQLLCNIQEPYDDVEQWNNNILIEVDADNTPNQYIIVTESDDPGAHTETFNVLPGQVNEFRIAVDLWHYGGITTVDFYKNDQQLSFKSLYITFPDIVTGSGAISSDDEVEGIVYLGQNYTMAGSYYSSPDVIKQVEEKVDKAEKDIEDMGDEIDLAKDDIQDLQDTKQDTLTAGTGITIATDTISVTNPIVLSTEDLTPNVSPLPTGTIYLVYE
jgi:hypothetical protein